MWRAFPVALLSLGIAAAQMDEKPPVLKRGDNPRDGFPSRSGKTTTQKVPDKKTDLITVSGKVIHAYPKTLEIEADDTRFLNVKISAETEFHKFSGPLKLEDLKPGMNVRLDLRANAEDEFTAVSVTLVIPRDKSAPAPPGDNAKPNVIPPPDDDGDRPVLRRGIPAKRAKSADDTDDEKADAENSSLPSLSADSSTASPASSSAMPSAGPSPEPKQETIIAAPGGRALLIKAREVNREFTDKLPNFVCQQFTTRYDRESKASGWQAKDMITANVVFVDGKEDYQNIKVGSRAVSQKMMDIKGQRSTGEFGTVLLSLLDHTSDSDFVYSGEQPIARKTAAVFKFTVKRENSDWRILEGGQWLKPAYSGRLWVDRESGRVLRIERQADKIPESFPIDTVEQTIDYDFVALGDRRVLLPTESANLSCQRGTPFCSRNLIVFRNYHQYRGQADLTFDK